MAKTMRCDHIAWMQCTNENNRLRLQENFRLSSIVSSLPDPFNQYPGTIAFYGKRHMQNALREVFPRNKFRRSSGRSLLNLRLDIVSERQDHPILFADGDLTNLESTCFSGTCHMSKTLPTSWNGVDAQQVGRLLHARLAWLFVDVICVFAEDYGGLTGIMDLISRFVSCGSASSLPQATRPSLIIATPSWTRSSTLAVIEKDTLHQTIKERSRAMESVFSSIKVLELTDSTVSSLARYRRLKEVLLNELDHGRIIRLETKTLFLAEHLVAFWMSASRSIASDAFRDFDFIQASRQDLRTPQDFTSHLSTFVNCALTYGCSHTTCSVL
ncbi:MAG: hypothetical protein GOMPHAMPRED_006067 [Gomphillus americanus]|uniref:Uncharacterized protein n=1 Tax=Gomphillus americanus TaxID=1940652 RepID=A0A8H3HYT1_9LECA|nr:MAG: hypothetical protein GOMPHAMPRED_006067 [Gomphillus americanus]